MEARPEKALFTICSVFREYMMAWRALTLSQGAFLTLNMMKRVPKPATWSTVQPTPSSWEMDSGGTDSVTSVVPSCWAVTRAVVSVRDSMRSSLSLAGNSPL